MIKPPHKFYSIVFVSIGVIWATFVATRYLHIENNFLFSYVSEFTQDWSKLFIAGIVSFILFILGGFIIGRTNKRIIILSIGMVIATIILYVFPKLHSILFKISNLPDGVRASLIVSGSVLMGLGLGFGMRLSHKSLNFGQVATIIVLPFLYIALKANEVTSVIALVWLFLVVEGLGRKFITVINRFGGTPGPYFESVGLLSAAVGLGLLILVTLLLGLLGFVSATGILLTLMALTVLCFSEIKSNIDRLLSIPWKKPATFTEFELAGLFMLTTLFLIFWVGVLAPEVGPDALGFRVAAPAIWLREGIIKPLPEMVNSYGYFAAEILHLILLPLTGNNSAKVLQFGLSIILIVSSIFQVFRPSQRKIAPILIFGFWGGTIVWLQMVSGSVDLTQVYFYFASMLALRFWMEDPDNKIWLVIAGITGATATTIKMNGAGALVISGLFVFCVSVFRSRSLARIIKDVLLLLISAFLCLFPWMLRSFWLTENPFFPFALDIFNSPLLDAMSVARFGVGLSFPAVLSVPWEVFFDPVKFVEVGTLHPFILTIAILGLTGLILSSSRKDWFWFVVGIFSYILWLVTEQNLRYSLFVFLFFAFAFSLGLCEILKKLPSRFFHFFIQPLLIIVMVGGFVVQALRPTFWLRNGTSAIALPINVVLGDQTEESYLSENSAIFYCINWLNSRVGEDSKLLLAPWIRDHLYFEGTVGSLPHGILPITEPLEDVFFGNNHTSDLSVIYSTLISEGYNYFIYDSDELMPYFEGEGIFSSNFEDTYLQLECADRGLRLFRIRSESELLETPIYPGDNLIKNAGFNMQDKSGLPLNWGLNGDVSIIQVAGNSMLDFRGETTITQEVYVNVDETYQLDIDFQAVEKENSSATAQINWYDSSGKLSLFWREQITPQEKLSTYSFYQTVPQDVKTAVIYISGSGVIVDNITFVEIP